MNYIPRSPDRVPKRKRPSASEHMEERPPYMRSGNTTSPRDEFRYTSDKVGRLPRDNRDRSSSPRNRRRDSGRRIPVNPAWNAYRPSYDSSPFESPVHATNSSPRRDQPKKKNDLATAPSVPSPPLNPNNRTDSIAVPKPMAKTAEPAHGTMIPQQTIKSQADAAKEFGDLLHKLIEEATDLAALKTQKGAAEKELNRRESDFNKTKGNHEKFPATEEVLKRSKEAAKKAFLAIGKKCKEKDTVLKEVVLQGAAHLLPVLGSGGQDEGLKLQVDSLGKRCLELENQLRNQQSFIENQRLARESLDEKYNNLVRKTSGHDKDLEDIKRESFETTRTLSGLSDTIPQDLKPTLDSLIARIDHLESLNASEAKEERISIATSKALADSTKTQEEYGQKLEALHTYVCGNGIKPGLAGHLSSLSEEQSAFREELGKAHPNWASVVERVVAVENQASRLDAVEKKFADMPSNVELANFRERISAVEIQSSGAIVNSAAVGSQLDDAKKRLGMVENQLCSDTSATGKKSLAEVERFTSLEQRLSVLEEQPHPDTSTAAEKTSLAEVKRLTSLENRMTILEEISSSPTMSTMAMPAAPAVDLEALKQECIAVAVESQSASDAFMGEAIDTLKAAVKSIQTEMDTRRTNFYVPLSALPAKLDALSQSVAENEKLHANYLKQIDTRFSNWADRQQEFNIRVDVVETGIINVNKRMDLMNTKEMAIYILNQMESTYPNLRDAQNTLVEHRTSLQRAEVRFLEMDKTIKELNGHIHILEGFIQQNPSDAAKALRTQVKELNEQVRTSTLFANEAKEAVDGMSKRFVEEAEIYGDKFGEIFYALHELKDQQTALATMGQPTVLRGASVLSSNARATPLTEESLGRAALGNGQVLNIRGRAKQGSEARQSSGEALKKRRVPNGTPPSGPRKNGVHGSPARKRKKLTGTPVEGEESDDSIFEPPQPTISDDEDD